LESATARAPRVHRVADVEQEAVPLAGAAGQPDRRVDGDVVALRGPRLGPEPSSPARGRSSRDHGRQRLAERGAVRGGGRAGAAARRTMLSSIWSGRHLRGQITGSPMISTTKAPRPGPLSMARGPPAARPCRGGATSPSKIRGELTIAAAPGSPAGPGSPRCGRAPSSGPRRRRAHAAGQLRAGAPAPSRRRRRRRSRVARVLEHRVRVRAAAGLHVADVARVADVADVEDADAAEPVRAHRLAAPPPCRSRAGPHPLARDEEEVAVDRHVALRRGADVARFTSTGGPGSRCPRPGSRCSSPGWRSCR
jgi:hypothetical protein